VQLGIFSREGGESFFPKEGEKLDRNSFEVWQGGKREKSLLAGYRGKKKEEVFHTMAGEHRNHYAFPWGEKRGAWLIPEGGGTQLRQVGLRKPVPTRGKKARSFKDKKERKGERGVLKEGRPLPESRSEGTNIWANKKRERGGNIYSSVAKKEEDAQWRSEGGEGRNGKKEGGEGNVTSQLLIRKKKGKVLPVTYGKKRKKE